MRATERSSSGILMVRIALGTVALQGSSWLPGWRGGPEDGRTVWGHATSSRALGLLARRVNGIARGWSLFRPEHWVIQSRETSSGTAGAEMVTRFTPPGHRLASHRLCAMAARRRGRHTTWCAAGPASVVLRARGGGDPGLPQGAAVCNCVILAPVRTGGVSESVVCVRGESVACSHSVRACASAAMPADCC